MARPLLHKNFAGPCMRPGRPRDILEAQEPWSPLQATVRSTPGLDASHASAFYTDRWDIAPGTEILLPSSIFTIRYKRTTLQNS
jgi:hypothetical protein